MDRLHFRFRISGRRFVYCYIRKNACSSFKALIRDSYIARGVPPFLVEGPIRRLARFARLRNLRDVERADEVFFVYREPVERVISMFNNKVVAERGNEDARSNIERQTGRPLEALTFRSFVEDYVAQLDAELDLHLVPQARHLLPIDYSRAIPLADLHDEAVTMFGGEIAGRYFSRPVNESGSLLDHRPQTDVAVAELQQNFRATGTYPSKSALLAPDLEVRLRQLYAADYEMIRCVSEAGA